MNAQQTYEVLKNAVIKDLENKDPNHNSTFGAVVGIIAALEESKLVTSVGPKLNIIGR